MCIAVLPGDMRHIVQALHIVADFGKDRVVPVLESALDNLDSFHLILQVESWEQLNCIAHTHCNLVLIQAAVDRIPDIQVFGLLVAQMMAE